MKMEKILKKVARANGVTVREVKTEIQAAINEAWKNPPDDAAAAFQRKVPCAGEIPTPDEFIRFMVNEIRINNRI